MKEKKRTLPIIKDEYISPGHAGCGGCSGVLGMRYALKALGPNTIIVIPACCWTIISGAYPTSSLGIPVFHTSFASTAAAAAGMKAAKEELGEECTVLAWAGDGGTFDIGIQALSGAVERGDDIIYICNDNEAYMNTGIQRSSSTPFGAWTTTTPKGGTKTRPKKNMPEIMAAHGASYVATASLAYPKDFIEKIQKAKGKEGVRYIQFCAPCTAGWKYEPSLLIHLARLAVKTRIYPVYEIFDGEEYVINKPSPTSKKRTPAEEYLKLQGRFKGLTPEQIQIIQENVDTAWEKLLRKADKGGVV